MATDEVEYLSLSTAAALAGVSGQTLWAYEAQGVLGPIKRDNTGRRLYTLADVEAAKKVNEQRLARHGRTGRRRVVTSTYTGS